MIKFSIDISRGVGRAVFVNDQVAWKILQALENIDVPPADASLDEVKRWHYRRAIKLHNGNLSHAAKTLGVSRETVRLYRGPRSRVR